MDNITESMMLKLKSVGFCYPDYEHHLNTGMVYAYQGIEYCIGGWENGEFTNTDRLVAEKGLWLPDGFHLFQWLKTNDFSIAINMESDDRYLHVCATDSVTRMQYDGGGTSIAYALHKVIYKICKSNRREYIPTDNLRLEIQTNKSTKEKC